MQIKDIQKIEKQNKININVFGYENKKPYPFHISCEKFKEHIELLLISDCDNKHYFYLLIKDFNRFMCHHTKHKI